MMDWGVVSTPSIESPSSKLITLACCCLSLLLKSHRTTPGHLPSLPHGFQLIERQSAGLSVTVRGHRIELVEWRCYEQIAQINCPRFSVQIGRSS